MHPGATELCDGIDNVTGVASADCPGDTDRDGVLPPLDCAPDDPRVFQNAPEHCGDTTSENCVDPPMACSEGVDADMDSYTTGTRGRDCDDSDPAVAPWATELCNDVDDDCDGALNEHGRALADGGCVFDPRLAGCGMTGACNIDFRALMGSIEHCSGCGVACNTVGMPLVANLCISGVCECSSEGAPGDIGPCAPGDTCCTLGPNQGCDNLPTSPRNCGFCGMVCDGVAAPNCVGGSCTCVAEGSACAVGLACCGPGCVDLASNDANCGFCGRVCGAGSACNSGSCTCTSADTFDCNGDLGNASNDGCETRIDQVAQCGACGASCMTPNVAVAACGGAPGARACAITSCSGGFFDCDGRAGTGCEVNLGTVANCRTCGTVCSPMNATAACEPGGCGYSACNGGFGDCDGNRVNGCETRLDSTSNCRACGTACSPMNATAACEAGGCGFSSCSGGFGNCDSNRVNGCETRLDSTSNCRACGALCSPMNATAACEAGGCGFGACSGGFAHCDASRANGCETPLATITNCTACGDVCAIPGAAESCSSGSCMAGMCDAGFADCGGMPGCETTLRTLTNCTGCGDTCGFTNAGESCMSGSCVMGTCDAGFLNCDGMTMTGCEVAISGTACGASCIDCNSHPNVASATCSAGTCNYVCDPGFGNCTGAPGCETTLSSTSNCGACGSVCGMDIAAGSEAETCVDTGSSVYRCRCRGTTASGAGEACGGANLCCSTGGTECRTPC